MCRGSQDAFYLMPGLNVQLLKWDNLWVFTATGLLLLRVVDPDQKTDAYPAFAYKQLLHEPFMGGGLWTSIAIPIAIIQGPTTVLFISIGVIVTWLIVWKILFSKQTFKK